MSDWARNLDTYNDGYGDPSEQDDFEMPELTTRDEEDDDNDELPF